MQGPISPEIYLHKRMSMLVRIKPDTPGYMLQTIRSGTVHRNGPYSGNCVLGALFSNLPRNCESHI